MYLIEQNGERMLVESLKGHKGCKVLVKNAKHPAHGHAKFENGQWLEDLEAKALADEEARLRGMTRSQLIEEAVRRSRT